MSRFHTRAASAAFRYSALCLAVLAGSAQAETPDDDAGTERIVVIGQAASLDESLRKQRYADSIESVVHADGIGQLPDANAAEALQRLPGVSVERDQGEGRFIRVRGLGPDLNAVTINGSLVPAPESGRRAVALDVVPAELVQSLTVVKSLTPDMDANSLGGTINVESLSGFDHRDRFYALTAQGGYDENTGQYSPKYSGAYSQRFPVAGGEWALAGALNGHQHRFGSENVETGGAWDFEDGARLESVELRDYRIGRERRGGALNLDYRSDEGDSYYLRTLASRFSDQETRQSAKLSFDKAMAEGETGKAKVERRLKDRYEEQTIRSLVLGGKRGLGDWTLSGQAGVSRAGEDTPEHFDPIVFTAGKQSGFGYTGGQRPRLIAPGLFFDPTRFSLDKAELESSDTEDRERNARLDLARSFDWAGHEAELKFGAKASRREKTGDSELWAFKKLKDAGVPASALSMSAYLDGDVDYSLQPFGQGIALDPIAGLLSGLDREDFYDEEASRIEDYRIHEDIDAAYVMQRLDLEDWQLIAGLRYEGTDFRAVGTGVEDGEFVAVDTEREDGHWLPGLHARYPIGEATQLRMAWTHSVVRPTFEQARPGFLIDGAEAEFGNPELKPLEASNLDLGIEHYLGEASVLSAFLFYKDIEHFVYNTDLAGSGRWADFDSALSFANGEEAELLGLELNYSHKLAMLPAPWNGLLIGANASWSHSEAEIENGEGLRRTIRLPNQSELTGNLTLGYETEHWNLRLTANYKSDYLLEVAGVGDKAHDVEVDAQTQLDFSAHYFLSKNLQVYVEAQNLNDEPYYAYTGRRAYNAQYEEYGPTYVLGLSYTHF